MAKIKMNICVIYDCEYPWDIRVEKIINSLSKRGHSISLIARNKTNMPRCEERESIFIYRLPSFNNKQITSLINTTLFFNPVWIYTVFSIVKKSNCDLILVRDLPLSGVGLLISKVLKIPMAVDFAEPYPLTIRQRRKFEKFKIQHLVTRNIAFADVYEKLIIRQANNCFVVCEEARERLIKRGAKSKKVEILRNTPELNKFTPLTGSQAKDNNEFIIMYVGILIGGRGLEVAIKAMSQINTKIKNIKLLIIGSGKAEKDLREMTTQLNLDGCIKFIGWIDNELVPKYINSCDVGILPFSNTSHINHTVANKLYDFMAMGKPVICSNVRPMVRIINETKCGYTFEADDYISLSKIILECYYDKHRYELGESGLNHIKMQYNWGVDEQSLYKVIECYGK
jgi:glycosyltransferase involved in cell wall biosynthesis